MKKSTRAKILAMFDQGATWTNKEVGEYIGIKTNTVSYHTGKLKKEGLLTTTKNGSLKRIPYPGVDAETEVVVEPEPTTEIEPPPTSIRLLLLAAREGIDEALARMDALETALLGGTESP